ncbi:MAG: hypothetical protein ACR2GU_12605 [Rubrobacteraceae bacterium]
MKKERQAKEDGRYTIFYTFEEDEGGEGPGSPGDIPRDPEERGED